MEKPIEFSDPVCGPHDGVDRINWVQFDGATFPRRGGKAVTFSAGYYSPATAASVTLAGFCHVDAAGVSGGHPEAPTTGQLLPLNSGANKTFVFPTTGRAAVIGDVGTTRNIWCDPNSAQYCNLTTAATNIGTLEVVNLIDVNGKFVSCRIPDSKLLGNL